jgi:hypothetical protein
VSRSTSSLFVCINNLNHVRNQREEERKEVGVQTVRFSGGARPCDGVDDEGEAMALLSSGGGSDEDRWWRIPPLAVPPSGSELGLGVGWRLDEPRTLSHRPHLLFIDTVRRGPPTSVGFDAPDQGADQRLKLAVGPNLVEINLIFPP